MYTCGLLLNSKMFCQLNRFLFSLEMDGSDRGIPLNFWLVWFSFWDSADLTWKFYGSLLISLVNKVGSLVLKLASVCVTPYVAWHERLGNWMLRDVKTIPQNFCANYTAQLILSYNTEIDEGKVLGSCFSVHFRQHIVMVNYDWNSACYREGLLELFIQHCYFINVNSFYP